MYETLVSKLNLKYGINTDDDNLLITCVTIANGYSFKIGGFYTPITIENSKSLTRLFIKTVLFSQINVDFNMRTQHVMKSKPDYTAIDFQLNEDVSEFLKAYLNLAIENYKPPKTFACCGRYLECSKLKRCIHPNQLYSRQCWYRDNIEKGIIFYT